MQTDNEIIIEQPTAPAPSPEKSVENLLTPVVDISGMLSTILQKINTLKDSQKDDSNEEDNEEDNDSDEEDNDSEEEDNDSEEEDDDSEEYVEDPRWVALNNLINSQVELTRALSKLISEDEE